MKNSKKIAALAAAAFLTVSPIAATIPNIAQAASVVAPDKKGQNIVKISKEEPLITKSDNFVKEMGNLDPKAFHIKAGVVQTIPGNTATWTGKTWMFQGREYLDMGDGAYLTAYSLNKVNGQNVLMLGKNSYVYNKKGKRIKSFRGQSKLLAGTIASYTGSLKDGQGKYFIGNLKDGYQTVGYKTIKGKDYVAIGNGGYIKIVNVSQIANSGIFTKGPITVKVALKTNAMKYVKGKMVDTKTKYQRNQKLVVDQYLHVKSMDTEDPGLYYHIKGTNLYIDATEVDLVNFQLVAKQK